jgi:uncharacterized protein (DUF608 family)
MRTWPILSSNAGSQLRRIALPLGGIGTGTVSLGGRGDLRDWEVMNVPAKGFVPMGEGGPGHIVLCTLDESGRPMARLAEGPIDQADWLGDKGCTVANHGLPRFARCRFDAAYPLAQVHLEDEAVPLRVRLEAFNPLVPGDVAASALPVAVLRYVVTNTGTRSRPVTLCASLPNHVGVDGSRREPGWDGAPMPCGAKRNRNRLADDGQLHGIIMDSVGCDPGDPAWGGLALALLGDGVLSRRCHWSGGGWGRPLLDFWDDLLEDGRLDERPDRGEDMPMASVALTRELAPGAETSFTVLIAWRFPNRRNWHNEPDIIGNHYATVFADAWAAAVEAAAQLPDLEARTVAFVASLVESDLPRPLAEAALSNLSTLRSQTCFRTPDGFLFGWEGVHDGRGSCHGSCTHVWNYEHATAQLFPELACGMREIEFLHATGEDGCMSFRVNLPLTRGNWRKAAADGQLGCLVKLWREWRLGGDEAWLRRLWPRARKALEFCWIPGGWDGDGDGVMEGCQHNTMDVEYCGPNPQMQGWYLAALRAAEEMARHLGDTGFAERCRRLYAHGRAWMDAELWNGSYYEHRVHAIDPATIPAELVIGMGGAGGSDLQLAGGCLVDQLVGQACALLYGLGGLHDPRHVATTLASIGRLNQRSGASDGFNPMRSFAMDDEPALVMAHYPEGRRPAVPFPYYAEVMTGFEYTAAIGMVQSGLDELALRTVTDIRSRHDGRRRNPFSEPECGHHYARAMASWGVLLAWTGQRYDAVDGVLHIGPREGTWPWCTAGGFGIWRLTGTEVELACHGGGLRLNAIQIGDRQLRIADGCVLKAGESVHV